MTRLEFIKKYCEHSEITEEWFHERNVALPCSCGWGGCHGWAAISCPAGNLDGVRSHVDHEGVLESLREMDGEAE